MIGEFSFIFKKEKKKEEEEIGFTRCGMHISNKRSPTDHPAHYIASQPITCPPTNQPTNQNNQCTDSNGKVAQLISESVNKQLNSCP